MERKLLIATLRLGAEYYLAVPLCSKHTALNRSDTSELVVWLTGIIYSLSPDAQHPPTSP